LRYVIGTEVPTPGGAKDEIEQLEVTRPEAVRATVDSHRDAFAAVGAQAAYESIIALVVQPGVEFDDQTVVVYQPHAATQLRAALSQVPGLVFEAHSTDYQPPDKLAQLVRDGFAILKVGPGLTFALRQALYGLDRVAAALDRDWPEHSLINEMEKEMASDPRYWQSYYRDGPDQQRWLRHFSFSDRIRYYWPSPDAQKAVDQLLGYLSEKTIPEPLISEFLPTLYPRVAGGLLASQPRELCLEAIADVLAIYAAACDQRRAT